MEIETRPGDWRQRVDRRGQHSRRRRHIFGVVAGLVVAGGVVAFVVTRPNPAAELTEAANAFARDWPTMPADDLVATWFVSDLPPKKRAQLASILERRGWVERRPEIRYVLDEMRLDETKGRSEYEIEGFPPDRHLEVFWARVAGTWRVTSPSFPVVRDE